MAGRVDDEPVKMEERWNRCMKDPECRARMFRLAVWASLIYTFFGFVTIVLLASGLVSF